MELYLGSLRQGHPKTAEAFALIQQYIHCHCRTNRQMQQLDQTWRYFQQSLLISHEISERVTTNHRVSIYHFQILEDNEDKQWHRILEHQSLSAHFSRIVEIES